MKAGKRLCSRSLAGALAVGFLACTAAVQANQTIAFVPTGSSGPFTVNGNEIIIPAGGVQVELEVVLSGWGEAPGAPQLGAYNATLIGASLEGAVANPSNPGVDLTTPTGVDCPADDASLCSVPSPAPVTVTGGCGTFEVDKCDDNQAGFIVLNRCFGAESVICAGPADCPSPANPCVSDPSYALAGTNPVTAVSIPATDNIEWIGAASAGGVIDPGAPTSGGFLRLIVPTNGKGSYTIAWNPDGEKTFMNDQDGLKIPGLTLVDGVVTIETGSCCSPLGPNVDCFDGDTQTECNARPAPRLFRPGQDCSETCPSCRIDSDCADPVPGQAGNDNLCTSNSCDTNSGLCSNTTLFDASVDCCNPDAGPGSATPIDDADGCTVDSCNPANGVVDHDVAAAGGLSCDDGFGCTVNDECDGANSAADGGCVGEDANALPCATTDDCQVGECNTGTGLCECSEDTPLCPVAVSGEACFAEGETVEFAIAMGAGSEFVTGGQFLIEYDPSCLELDPSSIGPCPGSILTSIIDLQIDEVSGEIFYAATVAQDGPNLDGTPGPQDLVCLSFTKLGGCGDCEVCLGDVNPRNTILTNRDGNRVSIVICENTGCSDPIRRAGENVLIIPDSVEANPDCDRATATITWDTPSATDSCDGALEVVCQGESAFAAAPQVDVDGLVLNGGTIPQGRTFFLCTSFNSCGAAQRGVWTVDVADGQVLDVVVQLSPTVNPGQFDRAIEFGLFNNCTAPPVTDCRVLTFGGPFNLGGHASATLKTTKGQYFCITAQDPLHTLRAATDVSCVDNKRTAIYKGDPILGGNWLIGGNLDAANEGAKFDDRNTINIVDFGTFISVIADGNTNPGANTDCDTSAPHADINADGVVDSLDFSFILDNFLAASKLTCCDLPLASSGDLVAIEEITIKELRRQGLGSLSVADLNGDGVLNLDDMAAYMQGVRPAARVRHLAPLRKDSVRGTR